MTEEPKFQVPPAPPKAPVFGAPTPGFQTSAYEKTDVHEEPAIAGNDVKNDFSAALKVISETKIMWAILGGCVLVGLLLGMMFFGGSSSSQQVAPQGLMGVVQNPDIRENLRRCGTVSNTSPCLVYIVNHSRDDRYAEYFFEEAAKLTGRAPYLVRIDNQHYAKYRIAPGYIAKIKIPKLN